MKKKDELSQKQQIPLKNIINELKKCDTYSRASKFYDKSIKSKKIRNLMKAMGLIKFTEFSEVNLFNKIKKKKDTIPFNITKVHDYLIREEQEEKEKEIIKREKLNNTIIKKLHQMTELIYLK